MTSHHLPDDERLTPDSKASKPVDPGTKRTPCAAGPLGELLAHIAKQAPHKYQGASPAEPPEIEYFQKTWERLSVGLRLQQSHRQVPENAGPLNSTQLIHRALLLMQDTAPEYLRHFLAHVEALSWMEQFNTNSTMPTTKPPAKSAGKTSAKPAVKSSKKSSRSTK